MSGKSDKSTHIHIAKDYKKMVKTALGRSKSSPVQMSGKSDKSTHESPPATHKITKKHIKKKQFYEKKKKRTDERSKRSGEPDLEKIPFDLTSHYISPKNKIPNTIQVPRKDFGEPNFCSSNSHTAKKKS